MQREKSKKSNSDKSHVPEAQRHVPNGCVESKPMPKRVAVALDEPLCYAQSVRYGKEVTLSGMWAYGRHGLLVADDDESLSIEARARAQTKQVFRNVHDALVAAGCRGLEDITSMVVSLVDIAATADPFIAERRAIMGDNVEYTSSIVGITGFPIAGGLVHLDVSAVVGRGCLLFLTDPIEDRHHALAAKEKKRRWIPEKDEDEDEDKYKANGAHAEKEKRDPLQAIGDHAAPEAKWVRGCVKAYPKPAHLDSALGGRAHNAIAVRYGKEVTLAGIWAYGEDTRLVPGDARQQTRQTLRNVRAALIEAGCRGLIDVVSINASLVDIADTFPAFIAERDRIMGAAHNDEYTSSIVGITAFPVKGGLVHVDVKAVVGRGCLLGASRRA
ncbi:Translation initiation inhibitor yjgf family [Pandoravirus kuranda]|uniref:Translation initiation inhibitor yjgf family n=1 Tax=Pandoravirus kuranda TaxID=3019033 RepID=A0AA95J3S2_9VIRU|nr:Translation initiation inhibitor yjgf family [Pandoravirus kuranda]